VINDVTYRILLVCKIVWKLTSKIVNLETAFQHGDLVKESYMDCPDGLAQKNDERYGKQSMDWCKVQGNSLRNWLSA
jgi:hypothetical protein